MNDDLGDRMKFYEGRESKQFLPMLPIMVRLDGKSFHTYTKGFTRPYDKSFSNCMQAVTKALVEEVDGCVIGYTQSDEISLIIYTSDSKAQVFFNGKINKIISVLASMCSVYFNQFAQEMLNSEDYLGEESTYLGRKTTKLAFFDCRAWQVPNLMEAVNTLLWREQDATRNSISMAAQSLYSHKELQNKSSSEMQEMIFQKGINWNDYPSFFKRGTYFQRKPVTRMLTEEELAKIPEKHRPTGPVTRQTILKCDFPPLSKIENRVEVIFNGADPVLKTT